MRNTAWKGFITGVWDKAIDVRDFIQRNYNPYVGDDSFLTAPTERTLKLWQEVHRLYDEEKKKIYEAHDAAMWEKYGRGIHAHEDAETGKELSSKLFMSDKKRPVWDLDYMMEIGFSKVFALKDISDISRTSMERELNKLTPQFLVGGEK